MTSLGFPVTSLILSYSPYEERQCESYVSYPITQHNEWGRDPPPPPPTSYHLKEGALKPLVWFVPSHCVRVSRKTFSQKSLTKRREKMITLSLAGGSGVFNMVEFLSTLANEASHSSNVVASQNLWSPWSFYEEHRHIQHHENIVTIWAIGFGEVFLLKVWLNRISIINKLIFIAYPLQTV